jgi:type I site-specific restriction endonuclease
VFTHKGSSIGSQHSSQDQEVRNGFKISLNPINIPLKIKKRGWKKKKKRKKEKDKKRLERGEIYQ